MRTRPSKKGGFSLIEIIGTLVLMGIAGIFGWMLIATAMQSYIHGREGAKDSQKIQVAMNRLIRDLTWVETDTLAAEDDPPTLTWVSSHPARSDDTQRVSWDGEPGSHLLLNNNVLLNNNDVPLIDGVVSFQVTVAGAYVEISLATSRAPGIIQTTRIFPRYTEFDPDSPTL